MTVSFNYKVDAFFNQAAAVPILGNVTSAVKLAIDILKLSAGLVAFPLSAGRKLALSSLKEIPRDIVKMIPVIGTIYARNVNKQKEGVIDPDDL